MRKSLVILCLLILCVATAAIANDWRSGINWPEPKKVTPGEQPNLPPSDAVVLFDGKDLSAWDGGDWTVKDGIVTIKPGTGEIRTKQRFGSIQLHLEFATPKEVKGGGQWRGNSGIFWGPYEVQILDSYDNETYFDGQCGSIYKQRSPLVNACRKPGEWQTYDILFNRPELKIEEGKVVEVIRPGYVTVFQNGVLIVQHHEIEGTCFFDKAPHYEPHGELELLRLQDHGDEVQFRNIWVREIPDANKKPERTREPYFN